MKITKVYKALFVLMAVMSFVFASSSCSAPKGEDDNDNDNGRINRINIVTTIFPSYDFAREIAGDGKANIKMLLKPGAEAHSYEPTPQDIISIQNCDVFVYVGGESDEWVKNILESIDTSEISIVSMIDCVDAVEEEIVEGMQAESDSDKDDNEDNAYEPEYDEHVWTSPLNAVKIVENISEAIIEKDLSNTEYYKKRTEEYIQSLNKLDEKFRDVVSKAKIKTIIFGDRFPCRYFADEYGLKYYAAFPGCSSETEASARTVSFLIDKVKEEEIPVVLYPELSNKKVAMTICESTDAKCLQFSSCHNVTSDEFKNGTSYLRLMEENVKVLSEALNAETRN